jgi:TolB protein
MRVSWRRRFKMVRGLLCCLTAACSTRQSPPPQYTVAFGSSAPFNSDIFIADGDGSHARPLASDGALDYNASLSRDGKWVVFTSHRSGPAEIYRVHPDGSGLERFTDDRSFADQATISPDGQLLAYVSTRSGQADIWVTDLTTRTSRNITNNASGDFRPAWSPDGRWIAFSSDRDAPAQPCVAYAGPPPPSFVRFQSTAVYIVRADGSALRRVTQVGVLAGTPRWSADGGSIIFYGAGITAGCGGEFFAGRATTQVMSVSLSTGLQRTWTAGPGEKTFPTWPVRGQVTYAVQGHHPGLALASGGWTDGVFDAPDWSPDHRTMVFHRDVESTHESAADPRVQRWLSPDSRFRLLRTNTIAGACSFSPRGDRIVCEVSDAVGRSGALTVAEADGSHGMVIFQDPKKETRGAAWSPNGEWIAFGEGAFFEGQNPTPTRVMLIRPDGSGIRARQSSVGFVEPNRRYSPLRRPA